MTLPSIDRADPTPRYLQAEQILLAAIQSGILPAGSKIPATPEIASLIKVSLITAHKALERLVQAGLLRREVGRGTFVCEDVDDALAAQKRLSIGLMLDDQVNVNDYYHASIIDGLRRASRSDDQRAEFFFKDCASLRRSKLKRTSGVICIHPSLELHDEIARMAKTVPLVVLGGTLPGREVPFVDCDNYAGSRLAIRHLHGLGHRRFAVLSGPMNLSNARDRTEGALKELAVCGVPIDDNPGIVFESKESVALDAQTQARFVERLKRDDRPTAVLAGGIYLALSALQTARQLGLRIPQEISIVGFDDPPSAPLLDPPLTTVRQPLQEMAEKAYFAIRRTVDRDDLAAPSLELPTKLIIRGSTAPFA